MSVDPEQGATVEAPENGAVTGEPEAGGQPAGFDLGPVMERLSSFDQRLDQVTQALQPEPEPEPEYDPYGAVDEMYDDPDQAASVRQALQQIIGGALQQEIQRTINPLASKLRELQSELNLGDLEGRYPDLAKDPQQVQALVSRVEQLAQRFGNPDLVDDPEILEMAYLASRAQTAAAQERPADGGNPAELESAAGSAPGEQQPDFAKEIVSAHRRDTGGVFF